MTRWLELQGQQIAGEIVDLATEFDELPTRAEFKKIAWNSMQDT